MPRHLHAALAAFAAAAALAAGATAAQDFPVKPVRIIVNNNPGVTPDIVARVLAPELSRQLGQSVIVENRSGADGRIGYEYVAKQAAPDGYTLALASASQLAILPWITKDLRFEPMKDLPPVVGLVKSRYVFAASARQPWKSFNEMVAFAKANPGKLNYGSSGVTTRFATEAVIRSLGLKIALIPYRAGSAYQQALVANEVQVGMLTESSALAQGDKVRPLAVTGEPRAAAFPNVPTFAELGHPRVPGTTYELNVPLGTPKSAVDKLYAAAAQALRQPEVKAHLTKIGMEVLGETPEAAGKRYAEEARLFAEIARDIGVKPE